MTVQTVLQYDSIMSNLIDNTNIDGIYKFKFLQMRKQFEPAVANFNKVREEILAKHSKTNDEGQLGIFQPVREKFDSDDAYNTAVKEYETSITKFNEELQPILDEEVKIEFKKFKAADIMNSGIPSDALLALYDLIEE